MDHANEQEHVNEQIQRAALERFGLTLGQKDYNLDRIIRLCGIATASKFAAFSVGMDDRQIYIATSGAKLGWIPAEMSICHRAFTTGEPLYIDDLRAHPDFASHPAVVGPKGLRSYIGYPVYAATKVVIGTLCVASERPRRTETPRNRRIMNDFVRLIEDSLMMRSVSVRDALTGLYNRRFYTEQIASEWRRAMRLQLPITMMMIDIDHFKAFNDSAGHLLGDEAIKTVGARISSCVRRAGDTLCRFGGEEFAMILPTTDEVNGKTLAEAIRASVESAAIAHPGHPKGPGRSLTVSIGMATIISHADLVEYSANDLIVQSGFRFVRCQAGGAELRSRCRNCSHEQRGQILSQGLMWLPEPVVVWGTSFGADANAAHA